MIKAQDVQNKMIQINRTEEEW